jgi:hypothetical protein
MPGPILIVEVENPTIHLIIIASYMHSYKSARLLIQKGTDIE